MTYATSTRTLGRTDVAITSLAFGGAPIGNLYRPVSDAESRKSIEAAICAHIRHFDTAPHYGLGLSEQRLGAALTHHRRDSFTVSTKVGRRLVENESPSGDDLAHGFAVPDRLRRVRDYSRDGIRSSLASSLERLGLDYLDVALVHDPDEHLDQALNEAIPELVDLRAEGVVRAVGVGMNQWQALHSFAEHGDIDVVMVAGRWTLLDQTALPLLDLCQERCISVLAAAPFNSGILARTEVPPDALFDYDNAGPDLVARARRLAATCQRFGVRLPSAALQFPLRHPAVAAVVCGMASAAEVEENASLIAEHIPDELWLELADSGVRSQ